MYQQDNGNTTYLNNENMNRLSEWTVGYSLVTFVSILGTILRLWCFAVLDEFFTFDITIKKNHKLITNGPYKYLIHPSYTGLLLWVPYEAYILHQLRPFVSLHAPPVYKEEALLRNHFRKEWDEYSKARKRFIPFII
ncbi:10742_t:CDS:2 [Acaulospora morrowiae]|uniref:Protein-S-isoprenylcysteine O-methyltransferase n=1 Tax=Acaulospora morrowiae TaxID=94023 RepID=A0A9N9G1P8_9GLOM|nr:10742_t:CDS:2 [Acaulospora morrowiae]